MPEAEDSGTTQNRDEEAAPGGTQGLDKAARQQAFNEFIAWLDRPPTKVPKHWIGIGRDVYARKYLLLEASEALRVHGVQNPLKHAATDVLVEKAQRELTHRAVAVNIYGALTYVVALFTLLFGAWELSTHGAALPSPEALDTRVLIFSMFRSSTSAALVFAAIYLLVAVAKALLREGSLLLNRRHALRYLRLCVYLTDGSITLNQLRQMVNWNAEFATAFDAIDTDKAAGAAPLNKLVEAFNLALRTVAKATPSRVRMGAGGVRVDK